MAASQLKVALVHDYLREYGGAERVLEALHDLFPDAPVYTAYYNPAGLGPHAARLSNWQIHTSWIQHLPFANQLISPLRLLAPAAFRSFNFDGYDLVISSCNIYFAKAIRVQPPTVHISYIHTPPRYLYGFATSFNYKKHWWTRVGGELINHYLRIVDYQVSQQPDLLIANSGNVAQRIKKFYHREAEVIYPPVDIARFKEARVVGEGGYFLTVNRLVRGKGTELAVEACTKLKLPLKVVGAGPEIDRLKALAGPTVQFLGPLPDTELVAILANAGATIVASQDEDFGIVPVESMAAGTPVIALKSGGFLETVTAKTGRFFDAPTVESLSKVLQQFDPADFKAEDCQKQAAKFSEGRFRQQMLAVIGKLLPGKV